MNETESTSFVLTAPEDLEIERTEAYQAIKDVVTLHMLDAKKAVNILAHVYLNESRRLNQTFDEADMSPALAFQYQQKIRELKDSARKLFNAEVLYFTELDLSSDPGLPLAC